MLSTRLCKPIGQWQTDTPKGERVQSLTLKVIHDMGCSWGISVRLTSSRVNFSSSKATVKMAPGGVQVPIMRWWMVILSGVVEKDLVYVAAR